MNSDHPSQENTPHPPNPLKSILSFLAFLLILIGQIFQYSTPILTTNQIPDPFWISVAGGILFLIAQFVPIPARVTAFLEKSGILRISHLQVLSVVFCILAILTMLSLQKIQRGGFIPVVSFWFFCGISYLASFLHLNDFSQVPAWIKRHRTELLTVLAITTFAAVIRFYALGTSPKVINGDEGRIGLAALSTVSDRLSNPFELFENIGGFYLQIMNFLFKTFGASAVTLRSLSAVGGVLAIPSTYLLARELLGRKYATISALTLAVSHSHIHFSRTAAVPYIQDTWFIPLELFFLFSALRLKKSWMAAAAGIVLAFHFNYYLSAQITMGFILIFVLLGLIFFRKWIINAFRQLGVFVTSFLLMAAPQIVVIIQSPGEFFNRLNNDGTIQSGWLQNMMQETGNSALQIFAERLTHSFFSLSFFPNVDFYGSPVPMLTLIAAACFLLGLIISLLRTRDIRYFFINGILWSYIFAVGLFSLPASADTYRLLIALPVCMLLVSLGLDYLLSILQFGWHQSKIKYSLAVGIVMISLFLTNLWVYNGEFIGRCQYEGTLHGRFASYLGDYAGSIDNEVNIYMLRDAVYFAGSHGSTEFLSHNRKIQNVETAVDTIELAPGDVIVSPFTRASELEEFAKSHPGGKWHIENDCKNPILFSYTMPDMVWTQQNIN